MPSQKRAVRYALGLVLLSLLVCVLPAQEFRATLSGTITDPTGAVIPGAQVTLKNVETAIERSQTSDTNGHYLFPLLPIGAYSLTVSAKGFKTAVRTGISLNLDQSAQLDTSLEIGGASETVTVTGEVLGVETQSSALGGVVSQDIIQNLPFKGHSSTQMFRLSVGAMEVGQLYHDDSRPNDTASQTNYSVNGSPMAAVDITVDGVSNILNLGRGEMIPAFAPSTEAMAEFNVKTGVLPAEYGFSAGGIATMSIKSGTNKVHGNGFYFIRNGHMDANLFFQNMVGTPISLYHYNTFGGIIGGPIYIPKVYDGRNRSFFFFSYEGARQADPENHISSVPTMKMRTGDFSEFASAIYNPFSLQTIAGVPTRTPFPNNQIPLTLQDPVAQKMMAYYPVPNQITSKTSPWSNDLNYSGLRARDWNYYMTKLDHQFSPTNQAYVRLNWGAGHLDDGHQFSGIAAGTADYKTRPGDGVALSDTITVNPRTVLDLRLGFQYGEEEVQPWSRNFDLSTLGFPSSYLNLVQKRVFPAVSLSGFTGMSGVNWQEQPGLSWVLQGSVVHTVGHHTIKAGAEGRLLRGDFWSNSDPSGSFSFSPAQTGGPRADTPVSSSGLAAASFLLGFGSGGGIDTNTGVSVQTTMVALYVQDDFRVTSRLVLNYGLRWEYDGPMTEAYNRTTRGWAYNTASPLKVPGLNLTGGLLYAGVNGQSRALYNADWNKFSPRFGLAYTLNPKTVIRTGYSLSTIPVMGNSVAAQGFSNNTPWVTSTDGLSPTDKLSNPFPNGLVAASGSSLGQLTGLGASASFVEPADRLPTFHTWEFNIQRELPSSILLDVGYVGTHGSKLWAVPSGSAYNGGTSSQQVDQLNPSYLSMGTQLLAAVPNPFYGVISRGSLSGATVPAQQLLLPYPQFTSVVRQLAAYGNSSYNALQARVDKRLKHGITFAASYAFSKLMSDLATPQNAYNRQGSRSVDIDCIPQRFNITAAWLVPLGKGQLLFGNASRALDLVIGGWRLSTAETYQYGPPARFTVNSNTLYASNAVQQPNVVGDPTQGISGSIGSRLNRYFNTAAFAQPANFSFGNVSPYIESVRAPAAILDDLSLYKQFKVTESGFKVEFRASAYNFTNHPVFGAANTSLGNAAFGTISSQANFSRVIELALKILF